MEYINLRVYINDCIMSFPPQWGSLTDAVSRAMRVCNDTGKSNDEAIEALRNADDVFQDIMYSHTQVNLRNGTYEERESFFNRRCEIHSMMIDRGVMSDHCFR